MAYNYIARMYVLQSNLTPSASGIATLVRCAFVHHEKPLAAATKTDHGRRAMPLAAAAGTEGRAATARTACP